MAISLVGVGSANNGAGATSLTIPYPSYSVGDYLIVAFWNASAFNTYIYPTNWTQWRANQTSAADFNFGSFLRRADGTEGSSLTIAFTVTVQSVGFLISVSGQDLADGLNDGGSRSSASIQNTASLTMPYAACPTWTVRNGINILFGGMRSLATPVAPTNYTLQQSDAASSLATGAISYRYLTNVTTVGALTSTWTGTSGKSVNYSLFLREASPRPYATAKSVSVARSSSY